MPNPSGGFATRILITGGTGLLGTAIAYELKERHDVTLLSNDSIVELDGCRNANADITDDKRLQAALDAAKPQAVVHTAALTNVDYCEDHREEATKVNEHGTANVAAWCGRNGTRLIHISTDYVFDGSKQGGMYEEGDATNPLGHYAASKLAAEKRVEEACDDYAIVRTTMYGWSVRGQKNFAMKVVEALEAGKKIQAFTNMVNTPMLANDLADVVGKLAEAGGQQARGREASGVFHAGGATRVNRLEFGRAIAREFGLDAELVESSELKPGMLKSPRPVDVSLASGKIERMLGIKMPTLEQGLGRFKKLREGGYLQAFKVVKG